jgi:hypothetical protein
VFESRVLRRTFEPKWEEATAMERQLDNERLQNVYSSLHISSIINSRRMG